MSFLMGGQKILLKLVAAQGAKPEISDGKSQPLDIEK
jgi:hypothetical protein